MNEQIEKIVDGVTYLSSQMTGKLKGDNNCKSCEGNKNGSLCAKLVDNNCSEQYIFKIKDITKQQAPPQKASEAAEGVKFDQDKIKYSLLPAYALEAAAKNMTDGLKKYPERDNWRKVDNAQERYLDALYRHLEAHRRGNIYDTDSSDPTNTHLAAVVVNAMFLLEFLLNPQLNKEKDNANKI